MASTSSSHDHLLFPLLRMVDEREEEEVPLMHFKQIILLVGIYPLTQHVTKPAGPSVPMLIRESAPMPDLDIPAEVLAEDAQAMKRFEENRNEIPGLNMKMQDGSNSKQRQEILLGAKIKRGEHITSCMTADKKDELSLADLPANRALNSNFLQGFRLQVYLFPICWPLSASNPAVVHLVLQLLTSEELITVTNSQLMDSAGITGAFVDQLPDDEIVDTTGLRFKPFSESASLLLRSRRKHLGGEKDDLPMG
ncbi:hypothetical protein Tco_1216112 [Tanacetum coccineum]